MYLHIMFEDGSNPYLMYGDERKLNKEIKKWKRNFDIVTEAIYSHKRPYVVMGINAIAMKRR